MSDAEPRFEMPRGARRTELGEVIEFQDFVFKTQHGEYPSMAAEAPHVLNETNVVNQRIIREGGHIRASLSIYPAKVQWGDAVLKIGGVGGVSTHPDSRGKGYARLLLLDAIDVMTREGYDLSVLWGIKDLYRKYGWELAGERWEFFVDRGTIACLPEPPEGEILTDRADPRLWSGVCGLHAAERRGVVRGTALTEVMLSMAGHTEVKLLCRNGEPVAYIVNRHGSDPDDYMQIWDFGGDAEAVLGLCRLAYRERERSTLRIETPAEERGGAAALLRMGFFRSSDYAGNILVLRPDRILAAHGMSDVRVSPTDDGWEVEYNGATLRYSKCELTKLLFGPERLPGAHAHPKLPLPFYYAHLDHM